MQKRAKRGNTFTDFMDSVLNSKVGQEVGAALSDGIRKRFGIQQNIDFGQLKKEARGIGEEIRKSNQQDPYKILGVSPEAEDTVIKAAYKAKGKLYHPDINKSDGHKMSEINKAYQKIAKQRGFHP